MKKEKVACVILNYNDAKTSIDLLEKIKTYKNITSIIVVDNASTDNSAVLLKKYIKDKDNIEFIENKKNAGYSGGNNYGIKYARYMKNCKYIVVANPDVEFDDRSIIKMRRSLELNKNLACVSPIMLLEENKTIDSLNSPPAFPLRPWFYELLEMLPLSRRVFHSLLAYSKRFYKNESKKIKKVGAIAGSLLMIDADKFLEVGGYDENTFLYCEESILGKRFASYLYDTAILIDIYYIHKHSISISKEFSSVLERQKLREKSALYYFKEYLHISKFKEYITILAFLIIRIEILLYTGLNVKNKRIIKVIKKWI